MRILCKVKEAFGGYKKGEERFFSLSAYKAFKDKLKVLKFQEKLEVMTKC